MHKTTGIIAIAITLVLLLTVLASAADTPTPAQQQTNLQVDTNKLIIEENAKVKAELKTYIDRKITDTENNMQRSVDENFLVLDGRLHTLAQKVAFQAGMIIILSIILGGTILKLIYRAVDKKRIIKNVNTDLTEGEEINIPDQMMTTIKDQDKAELVPKTKPKKAKQKPVAPAPQPTIPTDPDFTIIPAIGDSV